MTPRPISLYEINHILKVGRSIVNQMPPPKPVSPKLQKWIDKYNKERIKPSISEAKEGLKDNLCDQEDIERYETQCEDELMFIECFCRFLDENKVKLSK